VLQCVLQRVVVCVGCVLQGVCCSVLQCVAVCCSVLQSAAVCCNLLQIEGVKGDVVIELHLDKVCVALWYRVFCVAVRSIFRASKAT